MSFPNSIDSSIPTATKMIYDYIAENFKRTDEVNINRASAAPGCIRKRWYQKEKYPEEPMNPRAHITFLFGDLTERVMLYFIRESLVGAGKLYSEIDFGEEVGEIHFQNKPLKIYKQKTLTTDIGGIPVTCHLDGMGKRNSDGLWEVIEIKSSSNFGFDKFQRDGQFDYIKQIHVQMRAANAKSTRVFYMKKETSNVFDRLFNYDDEVGSQVVEDFKAANGKDTPPIQFELITEKNGRRKLPWQCAYCGFKDNCRKTEMVMEKGKPVFVVKE